MADLNIKMDSNSAAMVVFVAFIVAVAVVLVISILHL